MYDGIVLYLFLYYFFIFSQLQKFSKVESPMPLLVARSLEETFVLLGP